MRRKKNKGENTGEKRRYEPFVNPVPTYGGLAFPAPPAGGVIQLPPIIQPVLLPPFGSQPPAGGPRPVRLPAADDDFDEIDDEDEYDF